MCPAMRNRGIQGTTTSEQPDPNFAMPSVCWDGAPSVPWDPESWTRTSLLLFSRNWKILEQGGRRVMHHGLW